VNRLRLGLAVAGLLLAALSVAREDHQLGWAAIALLAGSLIIRLLMRKQRDGDEDASGSV
jgi:hypothetical protein